MRIAIGCDPNAMNSKNMLIDFLHSKGHEVVDFGSDDIIYANTAIEVAENVANKRCDRGILICGTGIGMSIAANKVRGAYAALITDVYSAERATKSNSANIGCFGCFTLGYKLMESLCNTFLTNEYIDGTGSAPKVERIFHYDAEK